MISDEDCLFDLPATQCDCWAQSPQFNSKVEYGQMGWTETWEVNRKQSLKGILTLNDNGMWPTKSLNDQV